MGNADGTLMSNASSTCAPHNPANTAAGCRDLTVSDSKKSTGWIKTGNYLRQQRRFTLPCISNITVVLSMRPVVIHRLKSNLLRLPMLAEQIVRIVLPRRTVLIVKRFRILQIGIPIIVRAYC